MARAFDVTSFFDQDTFSDITIKFGSRQRKCHKMILCSKSNYFSDLCGPGKHFVEAQQPMVELKDDDEEAVEAMLRWLYTFDYEDRVNINMWKPRVSAEPSDAFDSGADADADDLKTPKPEDQVKPENKVDLHLSVCLVSDKYMLEDLRNEALSRLRKELETVADAELVKTIEAVRGEEPTYPKHIVDVVNVVRDFRLGALVRNSEFRELMCGSNELCMEVLDKVLESKTLEGKVSESKENGLDDTYEEKAYFRCPGCRRQEISNIHVRTWICNNQRCAYTSVARQTVWMKKE